MKSRPWIWIVIGFSLFLIAWIILLILAHHANPTFVPLKHLSIQATPLSLSTKSSSIPQTDS